MDRDIHAYRGALGYPVPGEYDGRLSTGELPVCGLCAARTAGDLVDAIADGPGPEPPHSKCHELKSLPGFFEAVIAGRKTFEVRRDDRGGFHIGDTLQLREWDPRDGGRYTGREQTVLVTYKTNYEQKDGFVVLGIVCFR